MFRKKFTAEHINATHDDLMGNNGIGRYVFLPGSDERAKEISQFFENTTTKTHPRGHNLYLGTLQHNNKKIDVASISTGMGCPSTEIILHELFHLGAKRFLRVGTAGSLQPKYIKTGHIINVQAAVRDENTTTSYAPIELPAIASLEMINAILTAAKNTNLTKEICTGIVHCKSALYAREFGAGPCSDENDRYLHLLTSNGVLASEMETAALFIQSQIYNQQLKLTGTGEKNSVFAGAILGVVSTKQFFEHSPKVGITMKNAVLLAIETIKTLALQECD